MNAQIANADLRRDKFGRYLLSDIYTLAMKKGIKTDINPMAFLNSAAMKLYEPKIEKHLGRKPVSGSAGGYYVEEVIALKYANQLSHTFEVELYQTFQDNCKEDPTMTEVIERQTITVDTFPTHSDARVNNILSAIKMANEILSNTDGIDKRSCSECSLALLEANFGVDLSAAKLLLKDPGKETLKASLQGPYAESTQVAQEKASAKKPAAKTKVTGSSLASQAAVEAGTAYTMLPVDIAKRLNVKQSLVNQILHDLGLQEKVSNGTWRATEKTRDLAQMVKLGATGGYNRRLMWHPEIVTVLADHISRKITEPLAEQAAQ